MSDTAKNIQFAVGEVVSNKMDKSITVRVDRREKHSTGKYITKSSKICAHDEANECQIGDKVKICYARPISKRKSWSLVEVLDRKA